MIIGIGIDIVEVARIHKMIDEYENSHCEDLSEAIHNKIDCHANVLNDSKNSLTKIWTAEEIDYCNSYGKRKYEHFAARFAIKEAFSKAIGTGISFSNSNPNSFSFCDVSVINLETGKPQLVLSDKIKGLFSEHSIHISISHTEQNAVGVVVIEKSDVANR